MIRRERAPRSAELKVLKGGLAFEVHDQGRAVRVALSGILDRAGLDSLVRRVALLLHSRGRTVILDGRRLEHVDYRAVPALSAWNRALRSFGHSLLLSDWSGYLKTILLVGDARAVKPCASVAEAGTKRT